MLILAMLVFGTLAGGLARLLLPGRQHLSLSATTLAGLLGAATFGSIAGRVLDRGLDFHGVSVLGTVAGAVVFVAIGEWLTTRLRRPDRQPLSELLGGESDRVEYKASARFNHATRQRDPRIELVIPRTVAGFANADGGTLLIGIDDDAEVVGIDADLSVLNGADLDRYELWLHDLLQRCLGRAVLRNVRVAFERLEGHDVARIDVQPAPAPVFLRPHTGEKHPRFVVRLGNSTRELEVDEAVGYVALQWPQGLGQRIRAARRAARSRVVRR